MEGPGVLLAGGPIAFAVYHCGRRILNTHWKEKAQFKDWRRVAAALDAFIDPEGYRTYIDQAEAEFRSGRVH